MAEQDKDYRQGLLNRRRVLGDAWVDKSLANVNDFNGEFQNLISRYASPDGAVHHDRAQGR
jgi:4-carboxymuconolactone decarboxylase